MTSHFGRIQTLLLMLFVAAVLDTSSARAQTCFEYVDSNNAKVPLKCVKQGDLTPPCSFDETCHRPPNDGSTCCTTIKETTPQTVLAMHTIWHECFGAVGASDNNNPPGRGQRWYAFHRQFELDFNVWRDALGLSPIESVEWCPDMNLEIGHLGGGLATGAHPANCGTGPDRPYDTPCPLCVAFPQCLFRAGAGPAGCSGAPSSSCGPAGGGAVPLTYNSLEEFQNVEEIATVLDNNFHGIMHAAVGLADRAGPNCDPFGTGNVSNCYVLDVIASDCSPRDPMFWRLHKALDDVVRAWQNLKPVEVMLVIDRSGSMSEADSSGSTKFAAALNAVNNFADLLDTDRADGLENRIGIVSYSSSANVDMPLTVADSSLTSPTGTLATTLANLTAAGPSGCTGIGAGIQKALEQLCPPSGNCQGMSASGRKAILVLTDGIENVPPCLQPAGASGGSCGSQCFGASLEYSNLEFTQLVSVGFGNASSLNGELLTLLSERQGGVYIQNPNAPGDDLKDFFVKAFGHLTSDFTAFDPKGVLAATEAASDIVEYDSCSDSMITFASGWQRDAPRGSLRLQVTTPSFNLVRAGTASTSVKESTQKQWAYSRIRFPYRTEASGKWSAQLIRPHRTIVNGFTPDSFVKLSDGIRIVRREIHRLCPDGCKNVLYFENKRLGPASAYEEALHAEKASGLIDRVEQINDPGLLATALRSQSWDLIVYGQMGEDLAQPYDGQLNELVCGGKIKAIITETRRKAGSRLLRCAGTARDESFNWTALEGDGKLFEGSVRLKNPGHPVSSYGLRSTASVEATARKLDGASTQAIVARVEAGEPQNWFINVLADGLSRLSPVSERLRWRTGEDLIAAVRILPSDMRSGGYDRVDARVEVEYPTVGLGTLLARQQKRDPREVRGERLDPRADALAKITVPTKTATFPLYDDGTHGDVHAGNAYWSAKLPGMGMVDGMYKLRFILDLTVGGCTTRRELVQSLFVDVNVKAGGDQVRVIDSDSTPGTNLRTTTIRVTPADAFGNLLGPGRGASVSCAAYKDCTIDPQKVVDRGDGSYDITIVAHPALKGVRLQGFKADIDIPLPCDDCPGLTKVSLEGRTMTEHKKSEGILELSGPAPKVDAGGVQVYLKSNNPLVLQVPASVLVPAGKTSTTFPVQVGHTHEKPVNVTLSATYGGDVRTATVTITPLKRGPSKPPTPPPGYQMHPHAVPKPTPRAGDENQMPDLSGSPSRGPADAPIVMVEYTDYQCGFCAAAQKTVAELFSMYPGKIRLVAKNLPLSFHPQARPAALAALAADRQGKFWEYRELLFQSQHAMSESDLVGYAVKLGLDLKRFEADRKDPTLHALVENDMKEAVKLGANGTPTFLMNGHRIEGARPLASFRSLIEELLAQRAGHNSLPRSGGERR